MPIITWRDEYNTNVEDIDVQHQRLVELVNNFHSSVEAGIDKNELTDLLVELDEFTRMHFTTEEKLMSKYNYPDFQSHFKEHKLLLKYMADLVVAASNGKYPAFCTDYDVSTDWALVHILEFDKSLGEFLNSKGVY